MEIGVAINMEINVKISVEIGVEIGAEIGAEISRVLNEFVYLRVRLLAIVNILRHISDCKINEAVVPSTCARYTNYSASLCTEFNSTNNSNL